jgi:predicted O-linked N-acetylglucosamine transferase (SPINDLY family)
LNDVKDHCERILAIAPGHPEAMHLAAIVAAEQGDLEYAERSVTEAVRACPRDARYRTSHGVILERQGRTREALDAFDQTVSLDPASAVGHFNRGNALKKLGAATEALDAYDQAIRVNPYYAEAMSNRADLLVMLGKPAEALTTCEQAIAINPGLVQAQLVKGNTLAHMGRPLRALECYDAALRLDPRNPKAHCNRANVLRDIGEIEKAVAAYQRALELDPADAGAHSNLIFLYAASCHLSPEKFLVQQRDWDRQHGESGRRNRFSSGDRPQDPARRLRVGYVSSDFRLHPVSFFFEPIMAARDRDGFEVFCYDTNAGLGDAITGRLREMADHWRSVSALSDAELAATIHADEIDILVDLTGHTAHNRLKAFTYKPAPVQATYLGFFAGTGLEAIDYWITDEVLHPLDTSETTVEKIYRLPRCAFCYLPPAGAPPVAPCPNDGERVVFGSCNHISKLAPPVIETWSHILRDLPGARLLIMYKPGGDPDTQELILRRFASHGISPDQLLVRANAPIAQYLATYAEVDIVLDAFPRTGGTTTAQALWMGVPVVTLAGERYAGRISASKLVAVGLADLITTGQQEYSRKAIALARDPGRREALRNTLRESMARSSLCDGPGLARALESAYRRMWEIHRIRGAG